MFSPINNIVAIYSVGTITTKKLDTGYLLWSLQTVQWLKEVLQKKSDWPDLPFY